jgi:hypothetical protein
VQAIQQFLHTHAAVAAAKDKLRQRLRVVGHLKHWQNLLTLTQPQQRHRCVGSMLAIRYAFHRAHFQRRQRGGDLAEFVNG